MDGQFSDRLKTVLSDPDAMETIAKLAKSFAKKSEGEPYPPKEEQVASAPALPPGGNAFGDLLGQPAIAAALKFLGEGSRERINLLVAMRPFVKEEKKEKLDRIIQTMKTLDLLLSAQKLL